MSGDGEATAGEGGGHITAGRIVSVRVVLLLAAALLAAAYNVRAGHHHQLQQLLHCSSRLHGQTAGCASARPLAAGNYTSANVHVLTAWSGSHEPYKCQIERQRQYCELHGFSYEFFNDVEARSTIWSHEKLQHALQPHWYKLVVLRSVIRANNQPGDWFLFIDNDVLFASNSVSMLEIINRAPREADMILAPGVGYNTHFLLLKNTAWVRSFLERVWRWRLYFPSCLGEQCAVHVALWDMLLLHKSRQGMAGTRLEVTIPRDKKQICCDIGRLYNLKSSQGCMWAWQTRLNLQHPKIYVDTVEPELNLQHPVKKLGPHCNRDISKVARGTLSFENQSKPVNMSDGSIIGMPRPLVLWRQKAEQHQDTTPEKVDTCVLLLGTQASEAHTFNFNLRTFRHGFKSYVAPPSQQCDTNIRCACYEQPHLLRCASVCNTTAYEKLCALAPPPLPKKKSGLVMRIHNHGQALATRMAENTQVRGTIGYEATVAVRLCLLIIVVGFTSCCVLMARMLLKTACMYVHKAF
jgi:hypothetical protein